MNLLSNDLFRNKIDNHNTNFIMNITEKDAEILDYVLMQVLSKGFVRIDSLKPLELDNYSNIGACKTHDYSGFIDFLVNENLIKTNKWSEKVQTIEKIPVKTKNFIESGGYTERFRMNKLNEKKQLREIKHTTIKANQVIYNQQPNNGNQSLSDNFKTSSLTQNTNNSNEKKPKNNWVVLVITLLIFPIIIVLFTFLLDQCKSKDSTKSLTPNSDNINPNIRETRATEVHSIKHKNDRPDSLSRK